MATDLLIRLGNSLLPQCLRKWLSVVEDTGRIFLIMRACTERRAYSTGVNMETLYEWLARQMPDALYYYDGVTDEEIDNLGINCFRVDSGVLHAIGTMEPVEALADRLVPDDSLPE